MSLLAGRRAVALAVVAGLSLGLTGVRAPVARADAVLDGAFSCAGAPLADARLTDLALTPDLVASGAAAVSVDVHLDEVLEQPPVVTLATRDGVVADAQPAVATEQGWQAQLTVPEDAPAAELGVAVAWADGQVTTCGLQARGLPSVVALHPTAPAAPVIQSAVAGDGLAVLTWLAGADGGAPLTGYHVVAHPEGQVYDVEPGVGRAVLRGLTNGVAHTFELTAGSAVGSSPSVTSAPVVPRRPLVLGSVVPAARLVTYGTASTVSATVRDASGAGVGGVPVELWARRSGSTTWVSLVRGTSASTGLVRLRAFLAGSSALALVHRPDAAQIPTVQVGSVYVAPRVTATPSRTSAGAAYVQLVTGGVAPGGAVGSPVQLQRYTSGAWHGLASGTLVTATAYRVRWTPAHAGRYLLRVVRPATGALVTGVSPTVTVNAYDTRISVAREILADTGTRLATTHVSGYVDYADAHHNLTYTAKGLAARRSSYQNAPGGSVMLDLRVLRLLRRIGQLAGVTVSEVAGGSHSSGSLHYAGRALDISVVNGVRVRRGSDYMVVVRACQAAGASQVYYPAHDPYGGHQGHVHCAFG